MATPANILEQVTAVIKGLSLNQKIIGGLVLLTVVGGLASLTFIEKKSDYGVLFSNLSERDAADVVSQLKQQRVPYQLAGEGTTILVPTNQVYDTRLSLAGEGLPRGGGVGFEIFDKNSFGTTDFVQHVNYQRALQGELARTIADFDEVESARVQLAIPKESVFTEDQKQPTASVSVRLRGRDTLTTMQIRSIVNLVACAVPGLTPENITVVDTTGRLLFHKDGDEEAVLSSDQLEYETTLEDSLRKKIEDLLGSAVGSGHVRAQVTAELNFDRTNLTSENFDPDGKVIRSEQMLTEQDLNGGQNPQGIPGAKGQLASFSGQASTSTTTGTTSTRKNITRNYEISKETRQVQEATGSIKRLSVAVMVDGSYQKVVDKDGKTSLKYVPRSPQEMQQFEKMVKNAIGYDPDRGDQVVVTNVSFANHPTVAPTPSSFGRWQDLINRLAMPLIYLLLAIAVLLFVVRPFFRLMTAKQLEARRTAELAAQSEHLLEGGGEEENLSLSPRGMTDQERIYKLAQSDPARAADLVRRWLREG